MSKDWQRLLNEGHLYKDRGLYEDAIQCYKRAMDVAQRSDFYRCQAHAEAGIASCYRALNRPWDAIDLLHKRYGIHITTSSIGLLLSVAAAYCDVGEYAEALYCLDTAWMKFQEPHANHDNRINVHNSIKSRVLKESGMTARELRILRDPNRYRR